MHVHDAPSQEGVGVGQTCNEAAPAHCIVDYSGLRLKNHTMPAISATGLDAM